MKMTISNGHVMLDGDEYVFVADKDKDASVLLDDLGIILFVPAGKYIKFKL